METPSTPHGATLEAGHQSEASGEVADIGDQLRQVTLRQQRFGKRVSAALNTDVAGVEVLSHLMALGPATPTELARHLGLSTATTTLVLNRLEAAGHITRERHPSDGRKLVVRVADASARRAAQQVTPLIEAVDQVILSLPDEQRAAVSGFLRRVLAAYEAALKEV